MLLIVIRVLYAFVLSGGIASLSTPMSLALRGWMSPCGRVLRADGAHPGHHRYRYLFPEEAARPDLRGLLRLLIGTLLSYLMSIALQPLAIARLSCGIVVSLLVIVLPYLCISFLLQTKDDFPFVIPYVISKEIKGGRR